MTLGDDHDDLPLHAERLVKRLETLRSVFILRHVEHYQHLKFSTRSLLLADHLRAVLVLASERRYPSALVILRTALEHHLMDRLLFLGNRWVQESGIKRKDVAAEDARLRALQQGARPDIQRWWYDDAKGTMNVVVRGIYSEGARGPRSMTLSRYYFVLDQYDPFAANPKYLAKLAEPFADDESRRQWAEASRSAWHALFTYDRLLANLDVNRLMTKRQRVQVDVHHRFLSGFVHATNRAYELAYGPDDPSRMWEPDHYACELILLYVITLAAEELLLFKRAAGRTPRLRLAWTDVATEIDGARHATAHFWFLSGQPTMYDRIEEVHTRVDRRNWRRARRVDPLRVPAAGVRYYVNPLKRLIELHSSSRELVTGLRYRSPFERADARRRK